MFTSAPVGLITPEQAEKRFGHLTDTPMRGNPEALEGVLRFAEGDKLVELLIPLLCRRPSRVRSDLWARRVRCHP